MKLDTAMIDWTNCPAVERNPDRVSGAWVFRRTRVPVSTLFVNLEGGATVDEFLEWFPGVSREHVNGVLEHAVSGIAPGAYVEVELPLR